MLLQDFDFRVRYGDDIEVELFSSYLDKNNKKLYEGDRVKLVDNHTIFPTSDIFEICYLDGCFWLKDKHNNKYIMYDYYDSDLFELVVENESK